MVDDDQVMIGQLDRLLTVLSLPRVRLGIVPARHPYRVPTNLLCGLTKSLYTEIPDSADDINSEKEVLAEPTTLGV